MIKELMAFCTFFSAVFCLYSESYDRLDDKIVDAYNSNPKKTQDVYISSMQILEKARLDRSHAADEWENKAQKLIIVACFAEADRAMDNKDSKNAYLWAMRGISNGASRGELDGIRMKQVYDYLKNLSESLAREPQIKEMKYAETEQQIFDYRKVKSSSHYLSRDKTGYDGKSVEKDKPYELLEGPAQDASSNLYVKIKYDFGTAVLIRYYKEGGWKIMEFPDAPGYYSTWQECADANAKNIKLKNMPSSPVKKHAAGKKKYYEPEKSSEKENKD